MLSENEYCFIYSRVPRFCVSFVISVGNQIPLLKRSTAPNEGKWCLPGGRVYREESLDDAAARVLGRECGLSEFLLGEPLGVIWAPLQEYSGGLRIQNVDAVYAVRANKRDFGKPSDSDVVGWWSDCPNEIDPTQDSFIRREFARRS